MAENGSVSAIDVITAEFPWLVETGLDKVLVGLVTEDSSDAEVVAKLRQTPQYKQAFPGMTDENGQRRFSSEAEYLQRRREYKSVLQSHNIDTSNDSPQDYLGFIERGLDPSELDQRLTLWDRIKFEGQSVKDAFYVYAGMRLSDEDMFQAMVDPNYHRDIVEEYNKQIAANPYDYETWVQRATELGLERIANIITEMEQNGISANEARQFLQQVSPDDAKQLMAVISFDSDNNSVLPLDQALSTFELAMLGSAATDAGLQLPTLERVKELQKAGVQQAQAVRSYNQYNQTAGLLRSAASRAHLGTVDQSVWEDSMMLGKSNAVQRVLAAESALGQQSGGFATQLEKGRLTQQGRRL